MVYRLEIQGNYVSAYPIGLTGGNGRKTGGIRKAITGFSKRSRKHLIDIINRLDITQGLDSFITLTYHGLPAGGQAKRNLHALLQWFKRNHPKVCIIWRMEFQQRGSIHFHLIAFNVGFIPQAELQSVWTRITGEDRSIVNIKKIKNSKHLMCYVSKYIAKMPAVGRDGSLDIPSNLHADDLWVGRFWGIHNRQYLPLAPLHMIDFVGEQATKYLKWGLWVLTNGRVPKSPLRQTAYTSDAYQIRKMLLEIADYVYP